MASIEKELNKPLEKENCAFNVATVLPRRSSLKYRVWLDDFGGKREINFDTLRLKYGPAHDDFVTISFFEKKGVYSYIGKLKRGKPDIKKLSQWINKNYDRLIRFYKQEDDYDFVDFIMEMETVE